MQKTADAVLTATKRFITDVQAETGQRMTTLLTDNGGEYVNEQMSEHLLCKNIKHLRTVAHSPQQNGTAER
jgi:transposase InsO family protein